MSLGDLLRTISAPTNGGRGLTFDGRTLWAGMYDTDIIYQVDPLTGGVLTSFACPDSGANIYPLGLAFDGVHLWLLLYDGTGTNYIYELEPSGEVLRRFATDGTSGLTFDGECLWCTDWWALKIYRIDPGTGTVLRSIDSPGLYPIGLTFDGKDLWSSDGFTGLTYGLDPYTGASLKSYTTPNSANGDIAFDGKHLWHIIGAKLGAIYQTGHD